MKSFHMNTRYPAQNHDLFRRAFRRHEMGSRSNHIDGPNTPLSGFKSFPSVYRPWESRLPQLERYLALSYLVKVHVRFASEYEGRVPFGEIPRAPV